MVAEIWQNPPKVDYSNRNWKNYLDGEEEVDYELATDFHPVSILDMNSNVTCLSLVVTRTGFGYYIGKIKAFMFNLLTYPFIEFSVQKK